MRTPSMMTALKAAAAETSPRPRPSPALLLRHTLVWASRRPLIRDVVTHAPLTRGLVKRFVAGVTIEDAVRATQQLAAAGLHTSLDHLGENTHDAATAADAVAVYRQLVQRLADEGLAATAEVSVKLSAVGQAIDESMALDNARTICDAAATAGIPVTIDMEDHTTTDSTLRLVGELRRDFPSTGAVLQASLHRTVDDCRALTAPGSRIRLCKGAYQEPASIAWQEPAEVQRAFLRCLRALVCGGAYVMSATHDPRLIAATERVVQGLAPGAAHEHQMLYGVRPDEQRRLAADGERVRVYVPFGTQWYSYLVRRLAERPANLALILRASVSRG